MGISIYQSENRNVKRVPQLLHQEPCVQIGNALSLKADNTGIEAVEDLATFCLYFINTDK